jgi:hypothetical protein
MDLGEELLRLKHANGTSRPTHSSYYAGTLVAMAPISISIVLTPFQ